MAQFLRPDDDLVVGTWNSSLGGDLWQAIDEATPNSDTDYVYTGADGDSFQVSLSLGDTPGSGTRTLRVAVKVQTANSFSDFGLRVRLLEGVNIIETFFITTLSGSYTIFVHDVTGAITDYSNLSLEIRSSAKAVGQIRITQAEFEIPDKPVVTTTTTSSTSTSTTTTTTITSTSTTTTTTTAAPSARRIFLIT